MASKCTITFDNNPLGVYYAGQMVSGVAELITTRPKTIRSIYISVIGHAEVRWTENVVKQNSEGKRENAIETFSASELYFSSESYVYGQSGGSQLELPAGKYVYSFKSAIPPHSPTSFNGSDGQIQYEVVVVIDRVLRYNNTFKQGFTVISPYDLNLDVSNSIPMEQEEQKVFCMNFCCGTKDPIIVKIRVPFSAYTPGQKIRFNTLVDNQSDVDCSEIKVRLLRKVTYTSRSPESRSRWNEVKIAQNLLGEVIKHNKAELNEFLEVPSTVPSIQNNCALIKINYSLKFTVKLSGLYTDLDIVFPLIIGTVPLHASISAEGNSDPNKSFPPAIFVEDIAGKEQFQDNPFIPRYPVFGATNSSGGTVRKARGPNVNPKSSPSYPAQPPPQSPVQPSIQPQPIGNADSSMPIQIGWKA